jgi:hypothetical protein
MMAGDAPTENVGRRSGDNDRKALIRDIEVLESEVRVVQEQITLLRIEVGKLSVKAGIWGALAGAAAAGIPIIGFIMALSKTLQP